jgi:hypothetical protein
MGGGEYKRKHTSALPKGVRDVTSSAENLKVKAFRQLSVDDAAKEYSAAYTAVKDAGVRYDLNTQGMNSTALQYLVNKLDMHEPGVVLPDRDFDKQARTEALGGVVLYRGSSERAIQNIMYGDKMYIGEGIHGDGLYITTSKSTAKSYSYGTNATVTMYIDKSMAKVVKEHTLRNMLAAEPQHIQSSFRGNTGLSAYGLYKGYNVIHVPGGNGGTYNAYSKGKGGEDYYVPLTRRVLIMREHSKVK